MSKRWNSFQVHDPMFFKHSIQIFVIIVKLSRPHVSDSIVQASPYTSYYYPFEENPAYDLQGERH